MTELEPLSPDLQALFATERNRPGPDSDVADRLLSRVGVTLGFPPPGSGGKHGCGRSNRDHCR